MSRGEFGWEYPPGVTGNEPELTGEPYPGSEDEPCSECGGESQWRDDDDPTVLRTCSHCRGAGVEP